MLTGYNLLVGSINLHLIQCFLNTSMSNNHLRNCFEYRITHWLHLRNSSLRGLRWFQGTCTGILADCNIPITILETPFYTCNSYHNHLKLTFTYKVLNNSRNFICLFLIYPMLMVLKLLCHMM